MKKKDQTMSAISGRMHVVIEIMLIAFLLGGVVYAPEGQAAEQDAIQVYLEDQHLSFTVPPQTLNGRVMVPMRPIFEAMSAVLTWDQPTLTATAVKGNTTVITQIGNNNATINGMVQTLDVPPTAINGSALAPLRFVAEAFGYHVKWDGASQAAYIAAEPFPEDISAQSYNGSNNSFSSLSAGWLYLCQVAGSGEMYRMREAGTEYQTISSKMGHFTIYGDWLYYCNSDNKLCRIKTDGSQQQLLLDEVIWSYTIGEEWIYYNNLSDSDRLYKSRMDGSEKQRLGSDSAYGIKLEGDWLYYINFYQGGELIRIRIDGSERQVLDNGICNSVNISDDWIYYRQHTASEYEQDHSYDPIYKMNLDGEYRQKVGIDSTDNLNVAGNWIYYENYDDDHKMYRVGTDGSARQKICDDTPDSIDIAGDWIYYIIRYDYANSNNVTLNSLYRIKTDGTGRQLL